MTRALDAKHIINFFFAKLDKFLCIIHRNDNTEKTSNNNEESSPRYDPVESERVSALEGKIQTLENDIKQLGQMQRDEMNSLRSQVCHLLSLDS